MSRRSSRPDSSCANFSSRPRLRKTSPSPRDSRSSREFPISCSCAGRKFDRRSLAVSSLLSPQMELTTGSRLGPYEIVSRIGAGGMGEVFRARDTRLDRSVAIKILPSDFAPSAEMRARFEREARAISRLNHPHICTIHNVGHENGIDYLVMELIEGQPLSDILAKGPLPVDQVLRFGSDIADALSRAHKAGVVHRDLKPGNIMITRNGAKLLDFGLAKSGLERDNDAPAETLQKPLTAEGTIVGTFQDMAPEQIEGKEADQRTDIFSFGVVLYEMATGRRAFEGKTRT